MSKRTVWTVALTWLAVGCSETVSPRHERTLIHNGPSLVVDVNFSLRGITYGTTGGKFVDDAPAYCSYGSWSYGTPTNTYPIATGINPNPPHSPIYGDTVVAYRDWKTCTSLAASGEPLPGGVVNVYVTPPGQNRQFIGQVVGEYDNETQYNTVPDNWLITFDAIPNDGCSFIRYSGAPTSYSNPYTEVSASAISGSYMFAEFSCFIN